MLPLRSHTYHYYLELPMFAAAWAAAIVFDVCTAPLAKQAEPAERRAARTLLPAAWSWAIVALVAVNGMLLVRRCETAPFPIPGLLADPVVDRARIARNVHDGIARSHPAPGTRLALWLPRGWAYAGTRADVPDPDAVPYTRRNLRIALLDGLAVRVLFPNVVEARIVDDHDPLAGDWSWALCRPDGQLRVMSAAALDSLLRLHGEPR